jgi:hypothetical protein
VEGNKPVTGRSEFFDKIRPAFGGKLAPETVAGIEALLDAGRDLPLHHMANVLANVRRETGGLMYPIKETVMPWHKDKHPSDAEVIRRLNVAYANGRLPWVKTPYWRGGEFGRGQIQVTHEANRKKFGITNRDDLLKLTVSAQVAVDGMSRGLFRGKKLSDYTFPRDLKNPPSTNPRRIVNGEDGSDAEVAASHLMFAEALALLEPVAPPADYVPVTASPSFWAGIIAAILAVFGK